MHGSKSVNHCRVILGLLRMSSSDRTQQQVVACPAGNCSSETATHVHLFKAGSSLCKVELEATLPVTVVSTRVIAARPELPFHPDQQRESAQPLLSKHMVVEDCRLSGGVAAHSACEYLGRSSSDHLSSGWAMDSLKSSSTTTEAPSFTVSASFCPTACTCAGVLYNRQRLWQMVHRDRIGSASQQQLV